MKLEVSRRADLAATKRPPGDAGETHETRAEQQHRGWLRHFDMLAGARRLGRRGSGLKLRVLRGGRLRHGLLNTDPDADTDEEPERQNVTLENRHAAAEDCKAHSGSQPYDTVGLGALQSWKVRRLAGCNTIVASRKSPK